MSRHTMINDHPICDYRRFPKRAVAPTFGECSLGRRSCSHRSSSSSIVPAYELGRPQPAADAAAVLTLLMDNSHEAVARSRANSTPFWTLPPRGPELIILQDLGRAGEMCGSCAQSWRANMYVLCTSRVPAHRETALRRYPLRQTSVRGPELDPTSRASSQTFGGSAAARADGREEARTAHEPL